MSFKEPTTSQRVFITGKTGSGKTVFANWLLSRAPWHIQPYTIIDFKHDKFFWKIDGLREIDFKTVPSKPGLYIMHPMHNEHSQLDEWFMKIWASTKQGVYIDEGYMLPSYRSFYGFRTLLTQGRSLDIPLITLTQRPVHLDPFIISESDYFAVFHMNADKDKKLVGAFLPDEIDIEKRLPNFQSYWYDVAQNFGAVLTPAPKPEDIASRIQDRLDRLRGKRKVKTTFL